MTEQPNVILLTIDALRADHIGYHGYERDTTPFLDSLAEEVIQFNTAISASSHTREAVPALLSGEYPDVFAANGYRHSTKTIADWLSEAGYQTAGFHSNPYVSRAYGYDSGFDTFDDDLALGQNRFTALIQRALDKFVFNKGEYHARAEKINRKSLDWLASKDNAPFFLWNHYMDVHGPYNPPKGYTYADSELSNGDAHELYQKCIKQPEDVTPNERELLLDTYDGEIRYLDEMLKQLFDSLKEHNLFEESLVIVTADHGDAFGEHGYYTHPRYLHESLLHVPLLVSPPNQGTERTITSPRSTLDIVPTILSYTHFQMDQLPGKPLLANGIPLERMNEEIVYASATGEDDYQGVRRFAARGQRWKGMLERDIESGEILQEWIFDLQEDPAEQMELSSTETKGGEILKQLREFSALRVQSPDVNRSTEDIKGESDEIKERLEALGYK